MEIFSRGVKINLLFLHIEKVFVHGRHGKFKEKTEMTRNQVTIQLGIVG